MQNTVNKVSNETIRDRFNSYHKDNYEPNISILVKDIGIDLNYFYKWKSGKIDISDKTLFKIDDFLLKFEY